MEIVKLRKNQKLYKEGFTHAFKFNNWYDSGYVDVIRALKKIYNDRRWRGKYYAWEIDSANRCHVDDLGMLQVAVWIGVRSDKVVTQVLLSL